MALIKELRVTAEVAKKHQLRLRSIYLGGGTPTVLSASQLRQLTGAVKEYFPGVGQVEYTIEAGRPDTITPDKLEVIKASGATRISINRRPSRMRCSAGLAEHIPHRMSLTAIVLRGRWDLMISIRI